MISKKKNFKDSGYPSFKREIGVDSLLIDSYFNSENTLGFEANREPTFEESQVADEINYIINNMLPEIEKQIIYLLFFLRKNQETVGKLLGISQEMVYYYKKRALLRLRLHFKFRKVDLAKLEVFLEKYVTKKQQIAMIEYFKEHDLRKIAKRITEMESRKKQIHYKAIGSRIKLGIQKIKSVAKTIKEPTFRKEVDFYIEIYEILKKHNSLHHTQSKKQVNKEILA